MSKLRVVVFGHIVGEPTAFPLPKQRAVARNMLQMKNFTRVLTEDGQLFDHLAYLKRNKGLAREERFSVWEMYLCSSLLLASHLNRNGHGVRLMNYVDSDNQETELARARDFAPHIVVISTTFVLSRAHLVEICQLIRREVPGAFIVVGGHHIFATLLYLDERGRKEYLLTSGADAFVNDPQGEAALLAICEGFPDRLGAIPNVVWRGRDGIAVENPHTAEANDVNDTLLDLSLVPEGAVVHMRTARSCTFKCAFCSYPTIAGRLALMELDNVMTTLHACKRRDVSAVFFVDDTFNVPRERFEALVDRMIAEDVTVPWYSFLRCQFVDQPLVSRMKKSGCQGVFLGIESGCDRVLREMQKGAATNAYRSAIAWLRDEGITTVGSFIIGFPTETLDTVAETQAFIEDTAMEYYYIQPFYYLHHTPVHKKAAQYGLRGNGVFWSHNTMDSGTALTLVNRLFSQINNSLWINPDYTLWEVAYLKHKGMSSDAIKGYRADINALTARQMKEFNIDSGVATSRVS
jgi:radical SAM superfamily enzyme YgiQ (UPF0313 family)